MFVVYDNVWVSPILTQHDWCINTITQYLWKRTLPAMIHCISTFLWVFPWTPSANRPKEYEGISFSFGLPNVKYPPSWSQVCSSTVFLLQGVPDLPVSDGSFPIAFSPHVDLVMPTWSVQNIACGELWLMPLRVHSWRSSLVERWD